MKIAATKKLACVVFSALALFGGLAAIAWLSGEDQPFAKQSARLFDLEGQEVDAFANAGSRATVFLFVKTDCPISNRAAPEVNRVYGEFSDQGITFRLVYVDPRETAAEIRKHKTDYGYQFAAFRDPQHELVAVAAAKVTPEVAVFLPDRSLVYLGRIDNRYTDFGVARAEATERDLHQVLAAVLAGKAVSPTRTRAVGCPIQDLR